MRLCFFAIIPIILSSSFVLAGATGAEKKLAASMNDFACEFYQQVKGTEGKNLFFSPYSVQSALGMTYGGAKGETAKAMEESLQEVVGSLEQQMVLFHSSKCDGGEGDEGCSEITK